MNIFSYGGGVQSFTILTLIAHGKLPKPDKIVMADMSPYEPETLEFTQQIAQTLAQSVGLASQPTSLTAHVRLRMKNSPTGGCVPMPTR